MSKEILNDLFNNLVKEPKHNKLALGAMIEYVAAQQGFFYSDLAIAVTISPIEMLEIFTSLRIPDDKLLKKIADYLDTTVEILKAG